MYFIMKKSKTTIILVSIIVILLLILVYGVFQGFKVRAAINNLQSSNAQLIAEKDELRSQMDSLQDRYHLLEMDISKIYKTCPYENECKGRFPMISWYCNENGDYSPDTANAPYICVCNMDCQLNKTPVQK